MGSREDLLGQAHRINEDLEYKLRKFKELNARLDKAKIKKRAIIRAGFLRDDDIEEKEIQENLKKKNYDIAEDKLTTLEGKLIHTERMMEKYNNFMTRFIPIKEKWLKYKNDGILDEDVTIINRVISNVNAYRFDEAEVDLGKMEEKVDWVEDRTRTTSELEREYQRLIGLNSSLLERNIINNDDLIDNDRLKLYFKRKESDKLERLLEDKFQLLERVQSDFEKTYELYNNINSKIKEVEKKITMQVPESFVQAISLYEDCNYSEAIPLFEEAFSDIEDIIESAETEISIRIDMKEDNPRGNKWEEGTIELENNGETHLTDVRIFPDSDNFKLDLDEEMISIKSGEEKEIGFRLFLKEEGKVPIRVRAEFTDPIKGEQAQILKKFRFETSSGLKLTKKKKRKTKEGADENVTEDLSHLERRHKTRSKPLSHIVGEILPDDDDEMPMMGDYYSYENMGRIGSGGFSNIYRVKHGSNEYAMKVMKEWDQAGDETIVLDNDLIKQFKHEAKYWALATDNLPDDVVRLVDFNVRPIPWFVMEIADHSLAEHLEEMGMEERLEMIMDILVSFDRLHHLGIYHNDIKPENILFVDERPKVTDFGISKVMTSASSRPGSTMGTKNYLSPEQIQPDRFGPVDWKSDIWQLGVLIYEMLTEERPFTGSYMEITSNILHKDPKPPSTYNQGLEPLDEIILKALEKKKENRWESAIQMHDAIIDVVES